MTALDTSQQSQDTDQLRDEVDRLLAEADETMAVVKTMMQYEQQRKRLARIKRTIPPTDPLQHMRLQIDQTGFILVRQADQMVIEFNVPAVAMASYRQVISLFPETRWADIARERLSILLQSQGDQS